MQFITSKLEQFQKLAVDVGNAKNLINSCKPKLDNIKKAFGSTDDFYVKISGAIVSHAQEMLVTAVNEAQERLNGSVHKYPKDAFDLFNTITS